MKKNERGFSVIEFILILIVIALLGGVGWYSYKHKNGASKVKDDSSQQNSSTKKSTETEAPKSTPDPTAKWLAFSSAIGQYDFKYPPTWFMADNLNLCNEGLVLLGGNASSVGRCASESFGQINVSSSAGDNRADNELGNGFNGVVKTAVTVGGVAGSKQVGVASGQQAADAVIQGLADGTKVEKYIFFTNGRTYTATYTQNAGYPDVLSDFELLVTRTLKFVP